MKAPIFFTPTGSRRALVPACALLGLLALTSTLTGCLPVIAGGAVMTGVVATDRRTSGTQVEDEGIELRASDRLNSAFGDKIHQNVTSYNRVALITGEAATAAIQQQAAQLVGKVDNVRSVVNDLVVADKTSLSQRANDAYITTKVKASMIDAKDVPASAIKVVTERQVVYLMGLVTQREGGRATEVARSVDGVKKVVRVFEYQSEESLRNPSAPAADPGSANSAK